MHQNWSKGIKTGLNWSKWIERDHNRTKGFKSVKVGLNRSKRLKMDQNDAKLLKMIQYRVGLIHRKITEKIFEKKQTHHSIREKQESSFIFRPKKIMHGEDKCFELKVIALILQVSGERSCNR